MLAFFSKLYRSYDNSSITRFLLSYFLVLLLPLLIVFLGFEIAFSVVYNDINSANQRMIDHTKTITESELNSLRIFSMQVSYTEQLRDLSERSVDKDFFIDAFNTIEKIYSLPGVNEISLIDSMYVSIFNPEYIIANRSLYQLDFYEPYIKERGLTKEQWQEMCQNSSSRSPAFYSINGKIQYVQPFASSIEGKNEGAVVCNISTKEISRLMDFSKEFDSYAAFIFDSSGRMLWQKSTNKIDDIRAANLTSSEFVTVSSVSSRFGWKFLLVVPITSALYKLHKLKSVILSLISVAFLFAIFISVEQAVRYGKPLNSLFSALQAETGKNEPISHTVRNLALLFEDMEAKIGKNELFYPDLLEDNLILSIKAGNSEDTKSIIDLIENENCQNRKLDDDMFALLHGALLATLKQVADEKCISSLLQKVPEAEERSTFFAEYQAVCATLCTSLWEKKNKTRKELVERMINYVDSNFSDNNLSLSSLAQIFDVSETYISTVFKEQSGENFQSYLESRRIAHACRLLKETQYSVEDISVKSGYYTVQSFRRAFKKVTSSSPSEYRKS